MPEKLFRLKKDRFISILFLVHIKPLRQSDTPQSSSDFNDNPLISKVLSPHVFQRFRPPDTNVSLLLL